MRNAIILHGKPSEQRYNNPGLAKPHDANWLPWLRDRLIESGVEVAIPKFPKPYFPEYSAWVQEFETYRVDESTGLIGHSTGADFILRWLSENRAVAVERVVLVAPWHDIAGKYGEFSKYSLDPELAQRVGRISIFNSLDDSEAIQANVHRLHEELPQSHIVEVNGFGHFMLGNNMTSQEFPELLAELEQ